MCGCQTNGTNVEMQRWQPDHILTNQKVKNLTNKYAVVVLNRPIRVLPALFARIWNGAEVRATVDGGTNSWFTFYDAHKHEYDLKPPELVTGDFDSITEDSKNRAAELNATLVYTDDQNETDFTKSLIELKPFIKKFLISEVITIYESSGRIDQIMSNINTLFKGQKILKNMPIYLLSSSSLSWLLSPGTHTIAIPESLGGSKNWCALIPIGEKCVVTTSGLKWNLENGVLQFGQMVSSSNTYDGLGEVRVSTVTNLLWCMGTEILG